MIYRTILMAAILLSTVSVFSQEIRTVHASADSENVGYEAWRAMDGDTATMWHTQFSAPAQAGRGQAHPIRCGYHYACGYDHHWQVETVKSDDETDGYSMPEGWNDVKAGNNLPFPHEFRIDLGAVYPVEGFVYTPRQDSSRNGFITKYEIRAAVDAERNDGRENPVYSGEFEMTETTSKDACRVVFEKPISCRFFKITVLASLGESPFASIAELELLCEGVRFRSGIPGQGPTVARMPNAPDNPIMQEHVDEWNLLAERFKTPVYWKAIENEVYDKASLILPEDHDPVDVVLRRLIALVDYLQDETGQRRCDELRDAARKTDVSEMQKRFALFREIVAFRRHVLLESQYGPLKTRELGRELLFVKRHRSTYSHMCDQFYGRTQRPGGGLYVLSLDDAIEPGSNPYDISVRNILKNRLVESGRLKGRDLDGGTFLSPDVSFDGGKIAFAYVEGNGPVHHEEHVDVTRGHWAQGRCFHLFTCNVDGSDLRQLTDGTWNDFDPCWMPSGRLAFISERRNGYLRCGRECPTYTLFDVEPDGSKMRCLSFHETNEWNPSVTNDGKILYTRWDYVDRYGCIVHHPWLTTPDGRDPRQVHGNYSHRHRRADTEFDCRAIPGSSKYIATGAPHHGQSFGSLIMIDPNAEDDDAMGPVKRLTPEVGFPESQGGGEVYGTPWPLDETFFLCVADFSFQPGAGIPGAQGGPIPQGYPRGNDGIYLCDVFGNRELIYRDPEIACISPMPLASRPVPPLIPEILSHEEIEHTPYVGLRGDKLKTGTMSLVNVYDSLRPFPENTKIKELRIIQLLPMTTPSPTIKNERTGIQEASSLDSVNLARCILGTVPVEEDGSAHFELPAQIEFQFQALDEKGRAVQSMRSSSYLQPGENLSCNGCHEPKTTTPVRMTSLPRAFRRAASTIEPETVPGARPFSYPLLVQPVLDKHCVDCHAEPESKTFSLAKEPVRDRFYESYNNLAPKYGFTNYGDSLRTTPGRFGALASPLYKMLQEGHYDVKLSDDEMHRIVLWLDCVSNFYGVYEKEGQAAQLRGEVVWPTLE